MSVGSPGGGHALLERLELPAQVGVLAGLERGHPAVTLRLAVCCELLQRSPALLHQQGPQPPRPAVLAGAG